jgi:PII-like signaling protein
VQSPQEAILLRAFIGEADQAEGHALYRTIVEAARTAGLAGATVLHGPLSFGPGRRINSELVVEAPRNLPMIVEIVDTEDRIHAFLPRLEELIGSGLVTLEGVRMFRCGRRTPGASRHAGP